MNGDVVCLLLGDYRGFGVSLGCKFILYDVMLKHLRKEKNVVEFRCNSEPSVIFDIAALGYFVLFIKADMG